VFIVGSNQLAQVEDHLHRHHPEKTVHFVVQEMMRGQSDALYLAREHLHGPMLMSFSDTLIETDLSFLPGVEHDGVAWVKAVPDPRRFGVAEIDKDGWISHLVEKPQDIANNRAVVGFYYFRSGEKLMTAIEEQVQRNISLKDEFFLTDTINVLLEHGAKFSICSVDTWLDAGTRESLLETNCYLLGHGHGRSADPEKLKGYTIIPPVFIPDDAHISGSVIGPHVSLGHDVELDDVNVSDAIIEDRTKLARCRLHHTHIGKDSTIKGAVGILNLGDNSWVDL
jgi:glucose-1-phosphate thymidylyltransferase